MRELAELKMMDLLQIVEADRLPEVYREDVQEWLVDLWPDLTWEPEGFIAEIREILDDPRFPQVQAFFKARYDFDLRTALEEAADPPVL